MPTKKAAKKGRRFLVMRSECGAFNQLNTEYCYNPENGHTSLDAAKKEADNAVGEMLNDSNVPSKMFILEIVAEGTPSGITWE